MKKRCVVILLAAALVASNVPTACYLAHAQEWGGQTQELEAEAILCDVSEGNVVISEDGRYMITGTTEVHSIIVEENVEATIILSNVKVTLDNNDECSKSSPMKIAGTAKVTLILEGENELVNIKGRLSTYSGVEFSEVTTGSLCIEGTGSLLAQGTSYGGAGIGGSKTKNITINNGNIVARSGDVTSNSSGAGIGGSINSTAENIVINGGNIRVYAHSGAGIGGGSFAVADGIRINGGTIIVERNSLRGGAAGIGGGSSEVGKNITITGGTIITQGGEEQNGPYQCLSAGIGSGCGADAENIRITGGTITVLGQTGIGAYGNWGLSQGTTEIVVEGGSIKTPGFSYNAKNGEEETVVLMEVPNAGNIKSLEIDNAEWTLGGNHSEDDHLYCYVTGEDHLVRVTTEEGEKLYRACFIEDEEPSSSSSRFELKLVNEWEKSLAIKNWTYGETPEQPTASAKYGTPTYLYSADQSGTYSEERPTAAGKWYVKAKVEATDTYLPLESEPIQFQINPKSCEDLSISEITEDTALETVIVKDGETQLENGVDYEISQKQEDKVVKVTILFKGNYIGVREESYTLKEKEDDGKEDDGKEDGGKEDGVTDGGKEDGVTDGGKEDGVTDGGKEDDGKEDGGKEDGVTDGGKEDEVTDDGKEDGVTDGGKEDGVTDGGKEDGVTDGGKEDGVTDGETKEETKEETSSAVNTGDPAAFGVWGMAFALSGATLMTSRKRKKER